MENLHYGLTDIEFNLMRYFWNSDHHVPFHEIMAYTVKENYGWAQTTLHTYLTKLIKKGCLQSERNGYKRIYFPKLTEAQLAHRYAQSFVDHAFRGSITDFMVCFTSETPLSPNEVQELKDILDKNVK